MAKEETDVSSVSSSISINFENYNLLMLLKKFTKKLVNNRLKGLKNWLENRGKALEEELDNLKIILKIWN